MKNDDHFFATCDSHTLCRVGGNGPINVTQIMPLIRYVNDGDSFLDIGCGSGTTIDALKAIKKDVKYKGVDFIEKHIKWLKENYPDLEFQVEDARHLDEADQSWDVVWSRHVVDHLESFEGSMDEQFRVAKKKIICILWYPFTNGDVHDIKIVTTGSDEANNKMEYPDEFLNQYNKDLIMKYFESKKDWQVLAFQEDCVWDVSRNDKGHDSIIVLAKV